MQLLGFQKSCSFANKTHYCATFVDVKFAINVESQKSNSNGNSVK
jgi:hypothetical protein